MIDNQIIIKAAEALVEAGFAKSLAQIAVACGKSKQYFSDLKKEKSSVSLSFLDELCEKYPVNKDYLITGEGSPLLIESPISGNYASNIGGDNTQNGGQIIEALARQLEEKDKQIAKSQEQIDRLLGIIEKMS
jgi:transcriptional regulator with XRE-family HTH domain